MASLTYAEQRRALSYYKFIRAMLGCLSRKGDSIIDVGSNGIDLISFLPCKTKISIDLYNPLYAEGVTSLKEDFFNYSPSEHFDIACCFQVLEHIEDAQRFAQKLLGMADIIFISVPYKWKAESCKYHVQDPVCENKLFSWFGKEPLFAEILDTRLICIYVNSLSLQNAIESINGESFFTIFKDKLLLKKQSLNKLQIEKQILQEEYIFMKKQLLTVPDNPIFSSPEDLLAYINSQSEDFTKTIELYKIGIELFPLYRDDYGHPTFLKECIRCLLAAKKFKEALKLLINYHKGVYKHLVTKKEFLILLARAYESSNPRRALNIFRYLMPHVEAQKAIARITFQKSDKK